MRLSGVSTMATRQTILNATRRKSNKFIMSGLKIKPRCKLNINNGFIQLPRSLATRYKKLVTKTTSAKNVKLN